MRVAGSESTHTHTLMICLILPGPLCGPHKSKACGRVLDYSHLSALIEYWRTQRGIRVDQSADKHSHIHIHAQMHTLRWPGTLAPKQRRWVRAGPHVHVRYEVCLYQRMSMYVCGDFFYMLHFGYFMTVPLPAHLSIGIEDLQCLSAVGS